MKGYSLRELQVRFQNEVVCGFQPSFSFALGGVAPEVDYVRGAVILQNEPHASYIVLGIAPVAQKVENAFFITIYRLFCLHDVKSLLPYPIKNKADIKKVKNHRTACRAADSLGGRRRWRW